MTKNEWIWLSIRLTGLVLLVMALAAIPDAISYTYSAITFNDVPSVSSESSESFFKNMAKASRVNAVKSVTQSILYTIFGIYLLRHGKMLHKILSREDNA